MAVRLALESDAVAIASLSKLLGLASEGSSLAGRLRDLLASADHAVFLFEQESGSVVGWIHVFRAQRIQAPSFAEIGGLVVAEECQRQGIARSLVSAAQAWALGAGLAKLRVRTNDLREGAIAFYEGAGFEQVKTQSVLERKAQSIA